MLFILVVNNRYSHYWFSSQIINGTGTVTVIESSEDLQGNIIVLGQFDDIITFNDIIYSTKGGRDYFIAKYDENLDPLWFQTIGGVGNEYVLGGLCTCTENNIFIAGGFRNTIKFTDNDSITSIGGFDTFVASFSNNGDFLWARNVASGNFNQRPNSILFDNDQNILISGFFNNEVNFDGASYTSNGSNDAFLLKLDRNGNYISSSEINSLNSNSRVFDIVAGENEYYFTGTYEDSVIFDIDTLISFNGTQDVYVYKTDLSLNGLWIRKFTGPGLEYCYSVDTDNNANVYIGGYSNSINIDIDSSSFVLTKELNGGYDGFAAAYDVDGELKWFQNIGGISDDQIFDLDFYQDQLFLTGFYSSKIYWGSDSLISNGTLDKGMFLGTISPVSGDFISVNGLNGTLNYKEVGREVVEVNSQIYAVLEFASDSLIVDTVTYNNEDPGNLNTLIVKLGCKPISFNSELSED
jgi:hypothetical protein